MPNLPRVMLRAPLRVVAWMLLLLVGLAAPDVAPLADGAESHDPPRTAKDDSAPRRVTSSGSTIARSHSTGAVPNRGRTNARTV